MTRKLSGAILAAWILILISCVPAVSDPGPGDGIQAVALLAGMPVGFVQNAGQFDPSVVFSADCNGDRLYFLRDRVILATPTPGGADYQVSLSFGGADKVPEIQGTDPLPGKANYLIGNDPGSWYTGVQTFGGIVYRELYPGIDLSYKGTSGILKRELLVSPGADPSVIALTYEGVDRIALMPDGALLISTPGGALVESPPVCYQEISGVRTEVAGMYRLTGDHTAGFTLGAYDPSHPLVIDPALNFSSYLGGNRDESPATSTFVTQIPVSGIGVALDGSGMVYVTGSTESTNFPTVSARNYSQIGWDDVFVSKLDPVNRTIIYSTYLGGTLNDEPFGITVNSRGEATVTGLTDSRNFPVVNSNKGNLSCSGVPDVFVTRLNALGDNLTYSTYYGGCATDVGRAIAQIDDDSVVVTGWTGSRTNISTSGAFQRRMADPRFDEAFVAVFDTTNNDSPEAATYLGGTDQDRGMAVTFDNVSNQIYLTGFTRSVDFPLLRPLQGKNNGDVDAFVTIFDANLTALNFSSYLGGDGNDVGFGIAADPQSNAYLTGSTGSGGATFFRVKFPVFPVTTAYQRSLLGVQDAFITKIRPPAGAAPAAFVYSTYLGGSTSGPAGVLNGASQGQGIIVNNESNATIIGTTDNRDFPTLNAFQTKNGGATDVFITKINSTGTGLVYSTYLGGKSFDYGIAIAGDQNGSIFVAGTTLSDNFPVPNPLLTEYYNGGIFGGGISDAFVSMIAPVLPVADFTGTPRIGPAPLNVSFTDLSTGNPIQWFWQFGDGNTSSEQNPFHIYENPAPRNYTVNLTVTNIDGSDTESKPDYITIVECPTASFTVNTTHGLIPLAVEFTDTSNGSPSQWIWNFGDGTDPVIAPNNDSVTHTYEGFGNFTATLTVSNTTIGCLGNTSSINITAGTIVPDFVANRTRGVAPLAVNFTDLSTIFPFVDVTWEWTFGDGHNASTQNPIHIYAAPGNYSVELNVTNSLGSNSTEKINYIIVGPEPEADFSADNRSGEAPLNVTFTNLSHNATEFAWDFGDGGTSTASDPFHVYTARGYYNVTLNASNEFGFDIEEKVNYIHVTGAETNGSLVFVPDNTTVPTHAVTQFRLFLDQALLGLSGYNVTVEIENSSLAQVTGVIFPSWASPANTTHLPSGTVAIQAADLGDQIHPGATNVLLATINLTGIDSPGNGSSTVMIAHANRMDTDAGDLETTTDGIANLSVVELIVLPGGEGYPTSPDLDGKYWDVNGDGEIDFQDVLVFFNNMELMEADGLTPLFDFNENGRIDFNDLFLLFERV